MDVIFVTFRIWDGASNILSQKNVRENSCLLHKTNKCVINSRQPDSGLKHIHALARDRLLVPLDKKAP